MRLAFRQGLVKYQPNCLQRINNGIYLFTADSPLIATISSGASEYYHTEPTVTTPTLTWTNLDPLVQTYWLYIDINPLTADRTFGQTVFEPTFGTRSPNSPAVDQHWFDNSTMTMKVWDGIRWVSVIRVFVAQITGIQAFTYYNIGSQVGVETPYNSGRILFDEFGKVLRKSDKRFMTVEDQFFIHGSNILANKMESSVVLATADEQIPAFKVVKFSTFGHIALANYEDTNNTVIALTTEDSVANQTTNIVIQGKVTNPNWNWPHVNTPLWVDRNGDLTQTDPSVSEPLRSKQSPVARVIDTDTIFFSQGFGGSVVERNVVSGSNNINLVGSTIEVTQASDTWTINHNLGTIDAMVTTYVTDVLVGTQQQIAPRSITFNDANTITVSFSTPHVGKVIVIGQSSSVQTSNVVGTTITMPESTTWTVNHNLGTTNLSITVYIDDPSTGTQQQIQPDFTFDSNNVISINFSRPFSGKVVILGAK